MIATVLGAGLGKGKRRAGAGRFCELIRTMRVPAYTVRERQRYVEDVVFHRIIAYLFGKQAFAVGGKNMQGNRRGEEDKPAVKFDSAGGKGRGQSGGEKCAVRLESGLHRALFEHGYQYAVRLGLGNGNEGEIAGREVFGVQRNSVFKEIHLYPVGGVEADILRQEKGNGLGVLGAELDEEVVGQGERGKAFEMVGNAEKGLVNGQRAGLRG